MSLRNQHLGIFIGLSLVMHAAVLIVIQRDNASVLVEHTLGTLDVELILNQSVDSKAHWSGAEANKSRPHLKKPVLVAQDTVAEPVQDEASQFDTTDSADGHHNDTTQLADVSAVRKKISIEFLRYFYYPDAALRRNWQGDVILQFTLLPDGHLDHIRIHQSSGYKALDDAAIHALQQVEPQQELALLADAALLHTLPVSYRLTNPL